MPEACRGLCVVVIELRVIAPWNILYIELSVWYMNHMLPLIAILLLLLLLLIYGAFLGFSVAAGVSRRPVFIGLYTICAMLPIGITFWFIPTLIVGNHELSRTSFLLGCLVVNLVIHGLTRLFVYLYNH